MLQLIGDHLWQSTVCVGVAWLLTLALRKNHASIRFWVWFAASMKFLVPFAALVAIGTALPWKPAPIAANGPIEIFEFVSQPFSASVATAVTSTPALERWTLERLAATGLPALWVLGTLTVLGVWLARWRRIRVTVTAATKDTGSRERQLLSRLAAERGLLAPELRLSTGAVEPAVIGVRRPLLLWPAGISPRLTDAQVEAILSHELAHIARRDNLLALSHMGVQAIFWFHPLVWFIGTRLVHERERACDEEVVRRSGQREAYAEGILRTCEHCSESSLPCAAGVTGSDLKARVAMIMRGTTRRLGPARTTLLAASALAIAGVPVLAGLATPSTTGEPPATVGDIATNRTFEAVSIRPNRTATREGGLRPLLAGGRMEAEAVSARTLTMVAYGTPVAVLPEQIVGGPSWFADERFDVIAKAAEPLNFDGTRERLRTLLRDRFKLRLRREVRQRPILALSLTRNRPLGSQLRPSTSTCVPADRGVGSVDWSRLCGVKASAPGLLRAERVTLESLAGILSGLPAMHLVVQDRTGLRGYFDVDLTWDPVPDAPGAGPVLPTALQEQLGLRLVPETGPVPYWIVDHVEKPSALESVRALSSIAAGPPVSQPALVATPQPASPPGAATPTPAARTPDEPLASIKPSLPDTPNRVRMLPGGRLEATGVYVRQLINVAFEIQTILLAQTPEWTEKEHFDISAKFGEDSEDVRKAGPAMLAMLRDLLRTRFKLILHKETREMPVYLLVRSRSDGRLGERLKPSTRDCTVTNVFGDGGARPCGVFGGGWGQLMGDGVDLATMSKMLSSMVDRPVVDRTGLSGTLDLDLTYDSEKFPPQRRDPTKPDIFTAIKEQLGLELRSGVAPIEVTVVDRVERPTPN